jgi:hypothetical protein
LTGQRLTLLFGYWNNWKDMNRKYVIDALEAILEDLTHCRMRLPMNSDLSSYFDSDEFTVFRDMVAEEFDLPDDTIVDTAQSFRELVILLEDELF